jgi:hypothetical protein
MKSDGRHTERPKGRQGGLPDWDGSASPDRGLAREEPWRSDPALLDREKRTRTNDRELWRMGRCYPLRLKQKSAFKQPSRSGQFSG